MDWIVDLLGSELVALEYTMRLVLTLLVGGAIGLERERSNQAAGLRTHILIAIGAAMLMILSMSMAQPAGAAGPAEALALGRGGDPGRIAAQVVSGIGFIGAGTIMRFGGSVRGLTTAASIWIVAALGLAIGGGMYLVAGVGTVLALFTLTVLNRLERRFFPDRSYKVLEINVRDTSIPTDLILPILKRHRIHVSNIDVTQALEKQTVKMKFLVKIGEATDLRRLYEELNTVEQVYQVKLEQPG
jgi:putative Mg2+ transporter-C (MgtC) family protein